MRRTAIPLVASLLSLALPSGLALAEEPHVFEPSRKRASENLLDPERHELAGFPIIGGNSDIGVQFGGAATLTKFHDDLAPYLWNLDLLLSASVKSDSQNGTRLVQQSHVLRLDTPYLLDKRLRLDTRGSFQRTIDAGYYGVGNASSAAPPPSSVAGGKRYQYLQEEGRVRVIGRVHTGTPVDVAFGTNLRYEAPDVYTGSKLADDVAFRSAGTPLTRGAGPLGLAGMTAGVIVDSRDTEFVTTRGIYYQVGVSGTAGSAEGIGFGEAFAVLSHYAPLFGPLIFASRFVQSFQFGHVPFYDLQQGGAFEPQYLLGGENGVRGVPRGRYAGLAKTVMNLEIRSTLPRFILLKQRFRFGTTTFFDAGRVWSDYGVDPRRDGSKLGLKFGVGAGGFLQWGEAAIFRVELAYSPDAAVESPGFPVGIYVSDGLMF